MINYYGMSDKGNVRSENQDSVAAEQLAENAFIFVVCDGMGGTSGGKLASTTVSRIFSEQITSALQRHIHGETLARRALLDLPDLMRHAVAVCNRELLTLAGKNEELSGMGTTLVALVLIDLKGYIVNVGDSRAYLYSDGKILQITKDHSYVQFLLDSGTITEEEAKSHPRRNVITRSVGVHEELVPDIFELDFEEGEMLLMCTDGLSGFVDKSKILRCLKTGSDNEHRVKSLIKSAKKNDSSDNITALIIENRKG